MDKTNKTKITAEPGKQEIFIEREFDAPPEKVFKAHTDRKLYTQWLGPRGYRMKIEKLDAKNGGSWRYIHTDEKGNEFAFHGVYHEVMPPDLSSRTAGSLIGTFEFEGNSEKGHVELDTAKFEELPERRTKLTIQAVYQSVLDRDGMIRSGMEKGVYEGYERLDELLEKMK